MINKKYLHRFLYAIIFLAFSIFVLYSISKLLAYFNTGAEGNIYYLSEEIFDAPTSTIKWLQDDSNIEGEINKYVRSDIAKAYARSWHIRDLSIYHQKDLGLAEHFSPELQEKIIDNYSSIGVDSIHTQRISHNLKLHLISYDMQVASFSDIKSHKKSTVLFGTKPYTILTSHSYNIIMTLDDGVWRIRHLKQM